MSRARILFIFPLLVSLAMLLSAPALAQFGASLQGTVTDPSHSAVPNVIVDLKNVATSQVRTTIRHRKAFFDLAFMSPLP